MKICIRSPYIACRTAKYCSVVSSSPVLLPIKLSQLNEYILSIKCAQVHWFTHTSSAASSTAGRDGAAGRAVGW